MRITQAQARRTQRELAALRNQLVCLGVRIDTIDISHTEACIAETGVKLGYVLIARPLTGDQLGIYAIRVAP